MEKDTWIEYPSIYKARNGEKQYYTDEIFTALAAILCIAMLVIVTMSLAGVRYAKGNAGIDLQVNQES